MATQTDGTSTLPRGYRRTNPGGNWLREHQEDAEWEAERSRSPVTKKLLRGRCTARAERLSIPSA